MTCMSAYCRKDSMTGAAFMKFGLAPTTHMAFIGSRSSISFLPLDRFCFKKLDGAHHGGIVEQTKRERCACDSLAHTNFAEPPSGQGHRIPGRLRDHKDGIPATHMNEIRHE